MSTKPTQLTVTDLAAIKVIVENACVRGAFRAEEMKTVGEIYNKLVAFLTEVVAASQEADATQPSDDVAEPTQKEELND